jgi:ABC-type polar amino acid transport system ATPase subunit
MLLSPKGDLLELVQLAATRVMQLDEKDANRMLRSHVYHVSLMHMIEEYVYDFSGVQRTKPA